jgi:hypothetical protein
MSNQPPRDHRWSPYRETFHTLPTYYFDSIDFPETHEQAYLAIKSLELDIQNIDSQFIEKDIERAAYGNFTQKEDEEYQFWRQKAVRAQKMKINQIKLIEAWLLDNPAPYTETIKGLAVRLERIEKMLGIELP